MSEDKQVLEELKKYLDNGSIPLKGPDNIDKVYKDECFYCFDTPFSPDGLYISLSDFVGVCIKHIDQYVVKTSFRCFLNIKKFKLPNEESEEPKDKRLCLKQSEDRIGSEYSLYFYPHITTQIPINSEIGDKLREICDLIIAHVSAELQQRLQSGISEWDGDERKISKAAENLVQIAYEGKQIQYENWICAEPGCGLQENLWLNLSDGIIMCGRYAPMSGVKGNSHAKKHYENTGYPLVVKLGTIADGDGDIYSYSEDGPVRDPLLGKHLAHFGLAIENFKKTEKTTLELELDANLKYEFSKIQEEGSTLKNVFGPGFTGLINLGSSCYINSVIQMLYNVPDFLHIYGKDAVNILNKFSPLDTYEDFNCQLAKIVGALLSGEYSKEGNQENGIRPTVFRRLVGRGHVEFSTFKQQDAEEYLRHLVDKIDKNVLSDLNPIDSFRFAIVSRFLDENSGCVRYSTCEETILSLPIPSEICKNSSVCVNGVPRKTVKLESCLTRAFSDEIIDGYTSPVLKTKGRAIQAIRMGSFPDFLIIQIRRFTFDANFEAKKLDVDVEEVERIDLTALYSEGKLKAGEKPLPDDKHQSIDQAVEMDSNKNEKIEQLVALGFANYQAKYALIRCKWDTNAAAEFLFTRSHEIPPEPNNQDSNDASCKSKAPRKMRTGSGKYKLCAFISHMGSSPHSGHYVAHVKRENDTWYIFNDEKVAISQNPPKSLGYLYMYKRDD